MLSDLVDLDDLLEEITFEGRMGAPLKPFEQLLGCMPPSQSRHLPKPYRRLMTDENSPIIDFYPKTFTVDMNGKQWPWEAVVLLPFIDSQRLLDAIASIDDSSLTDEERVRNSTGTSVVMSYDPTKPSTMLPGISSIEGFRTLDANRTKIVPLAQSSWNYKLKKTPVLKPQLAHGVTVPLPGFGSLRDGPVQSLWSRKLGVNVFGSRSWYETACLELSSAMPPLPPLESLGPKLVGINVYVNYPYFVEGLVTAVSDETCTVRGHNEPIRWTEAEAEEWRIQRDGMIRRYETGEGYTGTGGLRIDEDQAVTLSVRPLEGIVTLKDGSNVKTYAKFEIEVPLVSTLWVPSHPDPRLDQLPARLEKDAFDIAKPIHRATPKSAGKKRGKLLPSRVQSVSDERGGSRKPGFYSVPSDVLLPSEPYDVLLPSEPGEDSLKTSKLFELLPGSSQGKESNANAKRGFCTYNRRYELAPDDSHALHNALSIISKAKNGYMAYRQSPNPSRPTRGFATLLLSPPPPAYAQTDISGSVLRRHASRPSKLGTAHVPRQPTRRMGTMMRGSSTVRGRGMLAASLVVASFFFSTADAVMGTFPFLLSQEYIPTSICRKEEDAVLRMVPVPASLDDGVEFFSSSSLTQCCLLKLRGGDFLDLSADQTIRTSKAPPLEFAHGTTTLSFTFQGGIIVAVDSRASLGSFVGSKTVQKVLPINSHMLGTMAGGAADCSFWIRKLKTQAMLHELVHGRRMSVARASRLLSNALYEQRGLKLSVGTMILGFDDPGGEVGNGSSSTESSSEPVDSASAALSGSSPPRIFYVDDRGVRIEGDLFAVGSGSTFALSILDTERRHDMTVDEAVALGIKAIRHATFRDAYSGGFINVFVITQNDGWKKVFTEDLAQTRSQLVATTTTTTTTKDETTTTTTTL
jgi:20S proteasome subunit beta 5